MPLELTVPAERTAPPKDLEIRPKQAKAWLDALPLAQSVESARQIRTKLAAMSRSKIEADDRVLLLEAYQPVVAMLLEELDAIYSKSQLPLTPKAREALDLARAITSDVAHGYKIVILEKTGKLIAFGAKKQLPLLIYRTMDAVASAIRAAYKSYTPLAPGLWKDMHQLYLLADKDGLLNESPDAEIRITIGELYTESLLLSLTDPYRLVQGEVDKTISMIRANKGLATLGKVKPATRESAHFLVPCDTDRPPKPAASASDDTGGPNWRLFDVNPLADQLKKRKQALETGNVSATMSRATGLDGMLLLAKLITLWGDPPKRAYRRDPMETSVAICAGLRTIGHFVSQEPKVDPAVEAAAIQSGITLPLLVVPDDDVSQGLQVSEWEVVNQSAGGLKVKRTSASSQNIAVGEALGIKFMGRARWTIGVVRWLTAQDDGGMEFGIQFLAPAARMVAVTPTITASGTVKLGLLLHESEQSTQADTLLTPPSTYSDLREYEIDDDGEVSCARATSLIEKTARFELFHISPS
ncbi:hypothetical protein [Usitatibacter palustris]|uniref:Cyclic-di-GMP receptor FimW n=1 Tax=Usitatibacter palustris TaxID=2732487 RepID=A0A6M4HBU2_9PROT|nr:hypothetical protein [Usitatibacter palustris]QJR15964.1 Cyclic-di-GMP receptor FimW [Usitatibacter palustris]